jgi:deoxycytidylate deaminase
MRSACLSRQVGAALMDSSGNILSTGSNEVPKAGGGVYGEAFPDDHAEDHRCAYRQVQGHNTPFCSNTREQNVIIKELIETIAEVKSITEVEREQLAKVFRASRIGGLIEFSRAVHAEMDAILSATRTGASTLGARLFVTTFPCHYCARHIVAAGIDEVQYIEPYPKSQAMDLHSDSIQITAKDWQLPSKQAAGVPGAAGRKVAKVLFRPFTGVAPRLYRRAFGKDRDLKNSDTGVMDIASPGWGSPWHLRKASYAQLEAELEYEDNNE